MALTPNASFSTITLLPTWDVTYSVEFRNHERPLGNNYLSITDGGNNNPLETVTLNRFTTATAVDTTIADLRSFQGSTAFNWRLFPNGNYKLYFCTSFSEQLVGALHKSITAELTRHPDPQHDPQPATVADGLPWGLLSEPIRWGAQQSTEASPLITEYSKGEVEARRPQSIFAVQNTRSSWTIEFPDISASRLAAIELFLRQRRGRIPFQFSPDSNYQSRLWICSRWTVRLLGQRTIAAGDMLYSMSLELRQVFRSAPVSAIGGVPIVNFATTAATISEGAATSYTITLSSATLSNVTIPFSASGSAIQGTDYTLNASSPLTITPGSTSASITVTALADAVSEGSETVVLTLGAPTNATLGSAAIATTTINNVTVTPSVTLSASSATVAEGANVSYTLTLSSTSASTVLVPFTLLGTATQGADYTITASPISIAAGATTATITIAALTDAVTDINETVIVTLGTPTNATLGATTSCTTTIADSSAPAPTVTLSSAIATIAEGVATSYTVTLSSTSASTVSVPFTMSGTATPSTDYTVTTSPVTIAPGSTTTTITINALTDAASEGNETAILTLGTPTNATLGATTSCTTTITNVAVATGYTSFTSDVGLDDGIAYAAGSITFEVYTDNVLVFNSGLMNFQTATQAINVSLVGKTTLRIVVTSAGNGIEADHGDWANARLNTSTGFVFLSDIAWASATNGDGIIRLDRSNSNNVLALNGVTYAKGIGVHAVSEIVYNLT